MVIIYHLGTITGGTIQLGLELYMSGAHDDHCVIMQTARECLTCLEITWVVSKFATCSGCKNFA